MRNIHKIGTAGASELYLEGLRHILDKRHFQIATAWKDTEDVLVSEAEGEPPSAILINTTRRSLPPARVIGQLRKRFPVARFVLVEEVCDGERIQEAVAAEFDGYLLETIRPVAFSKALELILIGERVFPVPHMPASSPRERGPAGTAGAVFDDLSASQMRVVSLLANAYPNKVIARELGISESTVKVHVKAILRKTGARNRTDIALLARGFEAAGTPAAPEIAPYEVLHPSGGIGDVDESEEPVDVIDLRSEALSHSSGRSAPAAVRPHSAGRL